MDAILKAELVKGIGQGISALLKVQMLKPKKSNLETIEETELSQRVATTTVFKPPPAPLSALRSGGSLPTSEETTTELKRRLGRELYRAELDLSAGLKIAGKPCDCLENKHTLMLEAAAEELISQDPGNTAYQDIIDWIPQNRSKVSIEAIRSGKYTAEYPRMANEFKTFRKRVMGSVGNTPGETIGPITLAQAKKMAAEEAAKEVEKAWKMEG